MHHRSHRERCLSTTTWPTWMLSSSDASRRPIALHAHRAPEADFTMRGRGRCRLASLKPFACGERVTSFGKCFLRISGLNAAIRALSSPCAREGSQPNAPRSAPNSRDARAHASRSGGCAPRPSRRTRRLQIAYSKCQRGLEAGLIIITAISSLREGGDVTRRFWCVRPYDRLQTIGRPKLS